MYDILTFSFTLSCTISAITALVRVLNVMELESGNIQNNSNEKRGNKQCLLDTPRRVTVNNKRLISKHKKSEKSMHIYKSHRII